MLNAMTLFRTRNTTYSVRRKRSSLILSLLLHTLDKCHSHQLIYLPFWECFYPSGFKYTLASINIFVLFGNVSIHPVSNIPWRKGPQHRPFFSCSHQGFSFLNVFKTSFLVLKHKQYQCLLDYYYSGFYNRLDL